MAIDRQHGQTGLLDQYCGTPCPGAASAPAEPAPGEVVTTTGELATGASALRWNVSSLSWTRSQAGMQR
jgi:hypothetical protein